MWRLVFSFSKYEGCPPKTAKTAAARNLKDTRSLAVLTACPTRTWVRLGTSTRVTKVKGALVKGNPGRDTRVPPVRPQPRHRASRIESWAAATDIAHSQGRLQRSVKSPPVTRACAPTSATLHRREALMSPSWFPSYPSLFQPYSTLNYKP